MRASEPFLKTRKVVFNENVMFDHVYVQHDFTNSPGIIKSLKQTTFHSFGLLVIRTTIQINNVSKLGSGASKLGNYWKKWGKV